MSPRFNAITLLVIAACACTANRRRTPDDTMVMAVESQITTIDPRFTLSNIETKVSRLIAPGLTTVDTPTAEPRFELAHSIDPVDDKTIDVTLRPDAVFSDGTPVRAEDVARTYESVMSESCGSLYRKGFLERYERVEAIGDKTVRFHFTHPIAMFRVDIEFGVISFHGVAPGVCRPPRVIGAGPFMLRSLTMLTARLDRNPRYPTPPRIAHVEIKVVRDAAARILMLVGGSLDLVQNGVRLDLLDDVTQRRRVKIEAAPSVLLTYMLLNNDDPVLKDVRVRKAIALAIDRRSIVNAKFSGRAVLATGILPPAHWAYNGDVVHYDHDIARATELLDAAGLRPDARGIRLHLVYKTSADAYRVTIARVIASQLRDAGIDVEIRSFEWATFFSDVKKGNYQIATIQSPEITEPDFHHWFFDSSEKPTLKNPDGGNRARYANAEVDDLVEAGRSELDVARRKALYARVQQIVADELPIIPLWHEDNVVLSNVDVQGYSIEPNARYIGLVGAGKKP